MSAIHPKAEIAGTMTHVRFGSKADIAENDWHVRFAICDMPIL
jgi:hypothetical protein